MNRLLVLSLFLGFMVLISSCGVDEELLPLTGEWRLENITGGFGGGGIPLDFEVRMVIDGDELVVYADDTTQLIAQLCYESDEFYNNVIIDKKFELNPALFNIGFDDKMRFYVGDNGLTFSDICIDCFSYYFVRI